MIVSPRRTLAQCARTLEYGPTAIRVEILVSEDNAGNDRQFTQVIIRICNHLHRSNHLHCHRHLQLDHSLVDLSIVKWIKRVFGLLE